MGTVKALPPHLRLAHNNAAKVTTPPVARETILTDEVLLSFGNRPDVNKKWPFMRVRIQSVGGCGRCGNRKARQSLYNEATRVKRSIIGLPQEARVELKRMLNAENVSMYLPTEHGVQKVML